MTTVAHLTLGDAGDHFNVREWQLRRLYSRGILPEPARVGRFRVIAVADLPAIESALRVSDYLRGTPAEVSR